ncbi:hypothetical protein ABZ027_28545 [Streptomyces sp. NPDC006332]|uniref:hypothetical protein n=1 Tax=Streptomyces sp. NPDC006332 TaxID=3155456 RepID=UPI0033AB4481
MTTALTQFAALTPVITAILVTVAPEAFRQPSVSGGAGEVFLAKGDPRDGHVVLQV